MVSLSAFRQNSTAIQQGEWVSPGEEFGDLEIRTRGFTDQYFDAKAALERKAARRLGVEVIALPAAELRAITIECVQRYLVLGVRNLVHDEGTQAGEVVSTEQFQEFLANPDLAELTVAVLKAAARVGRARKADLDDAVGNLSRPSGTTSEAAAA